MNKLTDEQINELAADVLQALERLTPAEYVAMLMEARRQRKAGEPIDSERIWAAKDAAAENRNPFPSWNAPPSMSAEQATQRLRETIDPSQFRPPLAQQ